MMSGFWVALRSEIYTGMHSLGSKLVVFLPSLLIVLQLLIVRLRDAGSAARENLLGSGFDAAIADHAYGYFVDALSTGLTLLGLILVAQAAYSFSFERDVGVLRHLIIRRCSRAAVVLAKLVYFHLLAILALLLLLLVSYLLSGWLWEFGPVVEDGFELIGEAEIRSEIALGLRLAVIPLPASIAFGLLVSVCASSATQAVTAGLGITLALDIFKGMMGQYADYLYFRFQPSLLDASYLQDVGRLVRGYSDVLIEQRVLDLNLWAPWPALFVFVMLSLWLVRHRKL